MTISNAIERGRFVYVYDEKGRVLFTRPIGSGAHDGLKGYAADSISIRQGGMVATYDATGRQVRSVAAR